MSWPTVVRLLETGDPAEGKRAKRKRSAAGVIGALPIVVFSVLVQRHLVRGLTMGAVKG